MNSLAKRKNRQFPRLLNLSKAEGTYGPLVLVPCPRCGTCDPPRRVKSRVRYLGTLRSSVPTFVSRAQRSFALGIPSHHLSASSPMEREPLRRAIPLWGLVPLNPSSQPFVLNSFTFRLSFTHHHHDTHTLSLSLSPTHSLNRHSFIMLGSNPTNQYQPMAWSMPSIGRSPDWVYSEASTTQYVR